jgi:hypothetical protein
MIDDTGNIDVRNELHGRMPKLLNGARCAPYIADIKSGGKFAMNIETISHEALLLPPQERAQLAEQL